MEEKKTKGRRKIPIEKIQKESDCFATFSKRRLGLFRKASELSNLCNIDVGVIIYSPTGKPFSFFHPSMESVVERLQNSNRQTDATRLVEAYTRTRVLQLNQMLDKLSGEMEAEIEREKQLSEAESIKGKGCRWEDEAIDKLDKNEVKKMMRLLGDVLSFHREKGRGEHPESSTRAITVERSSKKKK